MSDRHVPGGDIHADDLTWREQEILVLLAERLTNREIAEHLYLAESTVKEYVSNILSKLYVRNRRQAVERARQLGLFDRERTPTATRRPTLPPERTPFVGRREELQEISEQLGKTRLLSLTGPGGMGKTRLAIRVADSEAGAFADGVFFIPLAPLRSAKDIPQSIAEGLKFPIASQEDPQNQLLRYLGPRRLLLVIDNFEHLLDGNGIVNEILLAAPDVKILATSRERLNLQSETILHVGGMKYPAQASSPDSLAYDAITLFMQSARKVRPGFEPSTGELEQIVRICQVVGGMPLAIELAAAWLHILNVDDIAAELNKDLDILSTEVRDAPARHRSLRAVFDHSWSLLDPDERETFTHLSVFRGGFTRPAAQQVAGASLKNLAGLANKSFLHYDPDSGRLEIHELLRQYAEEHLEQSPLASSAAQEAHAAYYAEFMHQRWAQLKGERQILALTEIEVDIENVRAAWRYYLHHRQTAQIWKLIFALWFVYWIRWWNHAGMELFAEAVRALQGDDTEEVLTVRALAMAFQSYFMAWLGLSNQGFTIAAESAAILDGLSHPIPLLFAYYSLTINAYFLNRYAELIQVMETMIEISTGLADTWLLAFVSYARSLGYLIQSDCESAKQLATTTLKLNAEIGDRIGSTLPLIVLGHAALACGELDAARDFYLRCMSISQPVGFHYAIQTASKYLTKVCISLQLLEEAKTNLLQSLKITQEIGFVRDLVNLLYEYARLQAAQGNLDSAVELLALIIQHPDSREYRMLEGRIRDSAQDLLAEIEAELPPESFSAARRRGQLLELDPVVKGLVGS